MTLTPEYFEPWKQFREPMVRHLAFAVASPNILSHLPNDLEIKHDFNLHKDFIWEAHFKNYASKLNFLDQHPDQLHQFLGQLKSTRLGLRFEYLMWFWLLDRDYHPYELLGHSIQKIEGAQTLGELDFLLMNHDNQQIEHWEVALKYYLGEADLNLPNWLGLNRTDTLIRKLKHFTQKQFQFKHALEHTIQQRFAVLKGQLYVPSALDTTQLPDWANPSRRIGTWGTHTQHPSFSRLLRHEWICPNFEASTLPNVWWTDGLYFNAKSESFYMFRNHSTPSPLSRIIREKIK